MHKRLIPIVLLIAYSAILIKLMVLKDVPLIRIGNIMLNFGGTTEGQPNFVPLKTIVPYLFGYKGLIIAGINLVGNIVLLLPLGFLAPLLYRHMTWKLALALACATGLAIEGMQVVLGVGIFDIDDVILNAFGFMIGYWAFELLTKTVRSMQTRNAIIVAGIGVVAALLCAVALYQQFPVRFEPAVIGESDRMDNQEAEMPPGEDLCGGTGGNGQIVSVGDNAFTIARGDGSDQTIHLTNRATIKTPAGFVSVSDLKMGDRVTLVGDPNPDGSFTAYAVFRCSGPGL